MIYIQSNTERTLPHHFDCACALYGAIDSGKLYRLTSFEEVSSGKFDNLIKDNVFIGSVEFMREVFKRIGKMDVRLPVNSNRPCEIITLAEAHLRVSGGEKIFIKPVEIKLFTGLVLDGATYSCLKGLPDDTKVMAYKPFKNKILSEWRIYVHNDKVVDSRNYSGDFMEQPDYLWAIAIVNGNKWTFPCAYTMDIAIINNSIDFAPPTYEVVEFNDMWAIGNYGMPNDQYLKLLTDRYFEIVRL